MKIVSKGFLCVCLIALVLGLLPLYGCGGGGGSGGGGSGGGGSGGGAPALDSVIISKAEENEISEAAGNKPGRGSVTQSSNASDDGVTTDRVSVMALYSGGQVQYRVQNSTAGWSVDSAEDRVLARPAGSTWDGAELMKRLQDGDLYVDVYSVRENKDYVAGGFWIYVPDDATGLDDLDLGVSVDGSDPFRGSFPASGFGKHVGEATFMYSEDGRINFAEGTVRLDVGFAGKMVSGRIIVLDEDGYPTGVELWLEPTPFGDSNSDFFQGDTGFFPEAEALGFSGEGKWGGQFFGNGSGTPRVAGGTFGVTGRNADGDEIAALGIWAVPLDPDEIDSGPDTDPPPTSQGEIPPHPESIILAQSDLNPTVGDSIDLTLMWARSFGATSYKVHLDFSSNIRYRPESGGNCVLSTTPDHSSSVASGTSYTYDDYIVQSVSNTVYYDVQACNAAGCSCPPQ